MAVTKVVVAVKYAVIRASISINNWQESDCDCTESVCKVCRKKSTQKSPLIKHSKTCKRWLPFGFPNRKKWSVDVPTTSAAATAATMVSSTNK